ncbi:hypothetical protein Mapa_017665 [Marchantia paleacea]|nr:hypothetical protein Mapa_017665 [Marchantia paleacea]
MQSPRGWCSRLLWPGQLAAVCHLVFSLVSWTRGRDLIRRLLFGCADLAALSPMSLQSGDVAIRGLHVVDVFCHSFFRSSSVSVSFAPSLLRSFSVRLLLLEEVVAPLSIHLEQLCSSRFPSVLLNIFAVRHSSPTCLPPHLFSSCHISTPPAPLGPA